MSKNCPQFDMEIMSLAYKTACLSPDRSSRIGAVLVRGNQVLKAACNAPPEGIDTNNPAVHERPSKYDFFEHAERNAILECAAEGIPLKGSVMYTPWSPCVVCARAIIKAGIQEIVCHADAPLLNGWQDSQKLGLSFFQTCNVAIRYISGVPNADNALTSGVFYDFK